MRGCITNIIVLAVTLFLASCSIGSKIDQNLAEMRAMNKNMEAMNKNMATNMEEANKNFSTLVTNLRPDEMIDHIADRFDQTLAQLTEGTGDMKTLVKNGNEVSVKLLEFMSKFSAEELKDLSTSITSATASMKGINEFMVKHSDDIDVLTKQMVLMPQLFVTLGAGMGMIDPKDSDALIASLQNGGTEASADTPTSDKVNALDLLSSSEPLTEKVMFLTKERMQYARDNNYLAPLATFAAQLNKESKQAGSIKKLFMQGFWNEKVSVDVFMTCLMFKLVTMLELQGKGAGNANVTGTVTGMFDGTMNLNGTLSDLTMLMKSGNSVAIKKAYTERCKDIKAFDFDQQFTSNP
jgi:hypothetical protein